MNIISTSILRSNLADAISSVSEKKDYLLVSRKGKITSALVNIDLMEDLLAMTNKKYLASIKTARQEYEKGELSSHNQVFGET